MGAQVFRFREQFRMVLLCLLMTFTLMSPAAPLECSDVLFEGKVWGYTCEGISFHGLGDNTLQFIGCCGNGCNTYHFYCNDETGGLTFGTLFGAMCGCAGVDSIDGCAYGGCC